MSCRYEWEENVNKLRCVWNANETSLLIMWWQDYPTRCLFEFTIHIVFITWPIIHAGWTDWAHCLHLSDFLTVRTFVLNLAILFTEKVMYLQKIRYKKMVIITLTPRKCLWYVPIYVVTEIIIASSDGIRHDQLVFIFKSVLPDGLFSTQNFQFG
jgi:hypothetical protein